MVSKKLVFVVGVNPLSDKRSARIRRDSKMNDVGECRLESRAKTRGRVLNVHKGQEKEKMRLYKMEVYKRCHKKVFLMGILAAIGLMLLYFWFAEVGGEIAVVGDKSYVGYEAVQINKEITSEFEGIITNEKISEIVDKYGIPTKLTENMPGWRDGNYLNDFVVRYFTNGCWETGTIPTQTYTLEKSEMYQVCQSEGIIPVLAYTKGWQVFVEMLQFGLILGSVLIIFSISTVFAEEEQIKMLPIIFTTEEGKRKDITAKIFAAFSLTVFVFLGIVLFDFILCGIVYGLNGYENLAGVVLGDKMLRVVYQQEFLEYLLKLLLLNLQGLLLLCAVTLCVSAGCSSSFIAVIISAVCWGIPILLRMFLTGIISIIIYATPLFLVMRETVNDMVAFWQLVLFISVFAGVVCTIMGYRKYNIKEA